MRGRHCRHHPWDCLPSATRLSALCRGSSAIAAYAEWGADGIVAEKHHGGDVVESNIRNIDQSVRYEAVTISRGKRSRVEPVRSLYQQAPVHHLGTFPELEAEQMHRVPDTSRSSNPSGSNQESGKSRDAKHGRRLASQGVQADYEAAQAQDAQDTDELAILGRWMRASPTGTSKLALRSRDISRRWHAAIVCAPGIPRLLRHSDCGDCRWSVERHVPTEQERLLRNRRLSVKLDA